MFYEIASEGLALGWKANDIKSITVNLIIMWYTGSGDSGKTRLPSGGEVWKDEDLVVALGDLDELNSSLGVVISLYPDIKEVLEAVQFDIFELSSEIAGFEMNFDEEKVKHVEKLIEEYSKTLEPIKNFVLPGGHIASSSLHLSRAICRRAERSIVRLLKTNRAKQIHEKYLNRLSTLLFILALYVNKKTNNPNVLWRKSIRH
ncbi:conserved protein [Sulfolobus acidocaldarius DSM 639]|uniref:Conserved protein n=3 Tax=Sulfolobus acidocaldarius TaxID=2285 RepID=Q4J6D0_SULAC|nr:conserved protein [Sulfolobus acidocaldarius DSM 639]AGE72254.1 hypothetical protein SacN8_11550 [Sulfolobus acidocaldarius N8]AGE74571.1 hypothetical protein SacRon12I_11795 [Sulfolobus acidocaldarius Ron12/I]WCM34015.1 cob(I)yrinic acid a,c-diamide adenosyltransferase [Sulfolobus acidocaldarius DSM 639]